MLQPRYGQTPPQMAAYPWYNARLADLQSQLRRAKRQNPRSPEVRKLQRQYQTQLRHARTRHSQQEIQQEVLACFVLCLWQAFLQILWSAQSCDAAVLVCRIWGKWKQPRMRCKWQCW